MFFQYLSKHSRDLDTFDRALIWLSHSIHSIELKKGLVWTILDQFIRIYIANGLKEKVVLKLLILPFQP